MYLYLALGANLGDREANIRAAIRLLEARVGRCLACSPLFDTAPAEMDSELRFLNAAALFETDLAPLDILHITQEIERELGRTRKSVDGQHFDRTIDIDLLQYGTTILDAPLLTLPHPRMGERTFVMQPLAAIAPYERHALPPHPTFITMSTQLTPHRLLEVETATHNDWQAVNTLIDQLSPGKSITWDDYQALVDNASTHLALLFVPEGDAERAVGMITLCTTFCPTGRKAWIEDVTIHSDYRGRHLSHLLLDWAKRRAHELAQKKVMLTSRPSRVAANRLYQGEGFEARETNVYQHVF